MVLHVHINEGVEILLSKLSIFKVKLKSMG